MRLPLKIFNLPPLRLVSVRTLAMLVIVGVVLATVGLGYVTFMGERQRSSTNETVERETGIEGLYEDVRAAASTEGATAAAYLALSTWRTSTRPRRMRKPRYWSCDRSCPSRT